MRGCAGIAASTFVAAFAAIVLAYQPALRERLFIFYAPGADTEYASALPFFLELGALCREIPGVVLASPDDGSADPVSQRMQRDRQQLHPARRPTRHTSTRSSD